jgi:uncharacterized protein (DUF2384 family)
MEQEWALEFADLWNQLLRVFGTSEAAQAWLQAPSRYLGGVSPAEALEAGQLDLVCADLDGLAASVYL